MSMDLSIVWVSYFSYVKSKGNEIELFGAENNRRWRSSKSIGLLNQSDVKMLLQLQKLLKDQGVDHPHPQVLQ